MLYHSSVMKKGQCVAAVAAMAFVASTGSPLHVHQNDAEPMKGLKNAPRNICHPIRLPFWPSSHDFPLYRLRH